MGGQEEPCDPWDDSVLGDVTEIDRSTGRPDYYLMYQKYDAAAQEVSVFFARSHPSKELSRAFIKAKVEAKVALMELLPPSDFARAEISRERLQEIYPSLDNPQVEQEKVTGAFQALTKWLTVFQEIPAQPPPQEGLLEVKQWLGFRRQRLERINSSPSP